MPISTRIRSHTQMAQTETLHSKGLVSGQIKDTTQRYLDIREIKNDVVLLKDGTLRSVILVSSINFSLKSEEEQEAIIQGYVQFLNSFDFPIQIVIQSRKLNIDNYIERLEQAAKAQTNELLKAQTLDYTRFVREMVDIGDIMSKRFFVVVPYSPVTNTKKSYWRRLREVFSPTKIIEVKKEKFELYHGELVKRVGYVIDGLSSMGLVAVQLDTQSLIELYYTAYNPDTAEQQRLKDLGDLRVEGV